MAELRQSNRPQKRICESRDTNNDNIESNSSDKRNLSVARAVPDADVFLDFDS